MKKLFIVGALLALVLNLIWENAQAPLYFGYTDFFAHFEICLMATLGDIVIFYGVYLVFALAWKDWRWFTVLSAPKMATLAAIGFITAVIIERWALLVGRWAYMDAMPIVPIVQVGLLPVLQMMVLPLVLFYSLGLIYNKKI